MSTGSSPASKRWSLAGLEAHPVVRNYQFLGLAAMLVLFAVLALRGDLTVALLPALIAFLGLFFPSPGLPIAFLVVTIYLLACPFGLPFGLAVNGNMWGTWVRVDDLVAVAAVCVNLACQYRVMGLVARAMPAGDAPQDRKRVPIRRAPETVSPSEIERMFVSATVALVAGQVLWFAATVLRVNPVAFPPVWFADAIAMYSPRNQPANELPLPMHRLLVLLGFAVAGGFLARFVFWYWRLARLTPAEGKAILLDTGWRESRRELSRREIWRAWGIRQQTPIAPATRPPRGIVGWILFIIWVTAATIWGILAVAWYEYRWGFCPLIYMLLFGVVLWATRGVITNAAPPAPDPDAPNREWFGPIVQVLVVVAWLSLVAALTTVLGRNPILFVLAIVGLLVIWLVFRPKPQESE